MKRVTLETDYSYDYPISELEEYLKGLDGIIKVSINSEDFEPIFDISYDETKLTYKLILREICAFGNMPYEGSIWSWDTHPGKEAKSYELNIDGLNCIFCYCRIVDELFNTPGILSFIKIKGNFWKNDSNQVRIKLLYDDNKISKEELEKLCNKIKEDHC